MLANAYSQKYMQPAGSTLMLKLSNYTNTGQEPLVTEAQLQVASIFHCFKMQIKQKNQHSETEQEKINLGEHWEK